MANELQKEPNLDLLKDLRGLIDDARASVARTVNSTMALLYWKIGSRIRKEILHDKRAEYGKEVIKSIADQLFASYGKPFSEKNIRRMVQFSEVYPDEEIVVSLVRQLSWTHIIALIPINDPLRRDFYAQMCHLENWSVRKLRERIDSLLYERTAISKKPDEVIKQELAALKDEDKLSPDLVFRDPYFLDFLGLSGEYSEKDIESAILVEIQKFISELGQDFAFIARQKRIIVDSQDYYIDLLFYHRRLKSLVVIDLKIGDFKAAYKGQIELYLRYLEKYECVEGENLPIGLILCAGKNEEHVELLRLDESNIRVADYLTQLPPMEVLQTKLHQSLEIARNRLLEDENRS